MNGIIVRTIDKKPWFDFSNTMEVTVKQYASLYANVSMHTIADSKIWNFSTGNDAILHKVNKLIVLNEFGVEDFDLQGSLVVTKDSYKLDGDITEVLSKFLLSILIRLAHQNDKHSLFEFMILVANTLREEKDMKFPIFLDIKLVS